LLSPLPAALAGWGTATASAMAAPRPPARGSVAGAQSQGLSRAIAPAPPELPDPKPGLQTGSYGPAGRKISNKRESSLKPPQPPPEALPTPLVPMGTAHRSGTRWTGERKSFRAFSHIITLVLNPKMIFFLPKPPLWAWLADALRPYAQRCSERALAAPREGARSAQRASATSNPNSFLQRAGAWLYSALKASTSSVNTQRSEQPGNKNLTLTPACP